jgi:hypothetical protein
MVHSGTADLDANAGNYQCSGSASSRERNSCVKRSRSCDACSLTVMKTQHSLIVRDAEKGTAFGALLGGAGDQVLVADFMIQFWWAELIHEAFATIRENDQARACAAVARYAETGQSARPVFDLTLQYAISEDGALHAEKFYRTVTEEFGTTRPTFRWRQLLALARVTASEYGQPAPGYAEARGLLGI